MNRVTHLLEKIAEGDQSATNELFPLVYDQLRALAGAYFRDERPDHSLQPTALVHEAYLRLVDSADLPSAPRTRVHFQALAARVMRNVLVDHARSRAAAKRGGGHARVTLSDLVTVDGRADFDFEAIDRALVELASLSDRTAQVVELRFFGSMTLDEAAAFMGISLSSAEREWRFARAWLLDRLGPATGGPP